MPIFDPPELTPIADAGDPDDYRPRSRWALVADAAVEMAAIVEEIAPGEAIPLHTHTIDEVVFVEAGSGTYRLGGETRRVGAGAIVLIPSGTPHALANDGGELLRMRAVFPSTAIDIRYLKRNPAPGTESEPPQPPVRYDALSGEVDATD